MLYLRAEQGRWPSHAVKPITRPVFPAEKLDDKRIAKSRAKIGAILDRAHKLGRG